jgi:hypothetical protein
MAELADEHRFAGGWGKEPVRDSHSASWLFLGAADDMIRSLCRLFEGGATPVYGHIPLARAAVEACARAAWLAEPGVGVKKRVARGVSERLYSLGEVAKLPGAPDNSDRRRRILDEADKQGFARFSTRGQTIVSLEERRKGNTALVTWLFGQPDQELGEIIYRFWSAVSHSTLYGLTQSLDRDVSQASRIDSLVTVGLATRSDQVVTVMAAVGIAYIDAARFHDQLFGWRTDDWAKTVVNFLALLGSSEVFS